MPNSLSRVSPRDIENRSFVPITLLGGLDQETSKFSVPEGSLANCLNYNSSTRGYQRAQGLLRYDGTIDSAVKDMWLVSQLDVYGAPSGTGFTLGGTVTWGTNSSGTCVYYRRISGIFTYTAIGIIEVEGSAPALGDTLTDVETSTTIALSLSNPTPPATLATATYADTGLPICGTVSDYLSYLNGTVNDALVAQTGVVTNGSLNTYHGEVPGTGQINGGWQYEDAVYVVRDGYACTFQNGSLEFVPGDEVKVDITPSAGTTQNVLVAYVELTSGLWSQGTAAGKVVFMPTTTTGNYTKLEVLEEGTGEIKNTSDTPMADIVLDAQSVASLVWKGSVNGWTFVDTGWTIPYENGTNAPNVKAAPLFQSDLISGSRETTLDYPDQGSNAGSGSYISWTDPTNISSGANVVGTIPSGSYTKYLKCRVEADVLPHDDMNIIGIEVQIETTGSGTSEPQFVHLSLINEETDANFYQSANKADQTNAPTSITTRTYGGQNDTWGIEEITPADLNSGNCYFLIQYYGQGSGGVVTISDMKYKIYYTTTNEKVWFYDGSTDVATGEIHAYQISEGDFGNPNSAKGKMSLTNLTSPEAIGVGMTMYTEPSGGGLKVADVAEVPAYNVLPSSADMIAEGSQYVTIKANYYENDESEAIYGVSGAGPAFSFDGDNFAIIEAPLARKVDKPRHIAYHENRLALGYKTGHVVLSGVGTPNNFAGVDSASSWGVGDRVNGLLPLAGNVLGVFSESSINSLQGSSEATGTMRTISATTGVREYTVQNIAGPYYADNRGISSLTTSDKYGDFDMGRLTDSIKKWVQDRLQERRTTQTLDTGPATSVAMRNKNQYRIFFNDGYILVLYFRADGQVEPSFMHYDTDNYSTKYVPTWIDSTILSNGRERVMMGTAEGAVWVVDGANAIFDIESTTKPECWMTLNPLNFGRPESLHKHFHVVLQGQFYGAQSVTTYAADNYTQTFGDADTLDIGDYTDPPVFTAATDLDATYHSTLTDGYTLKIAATLDGSEPHTFQSLLFRSSRKAVDRNTAPNSY